MKIGIVSAMHHELSMLKENLIDMKESTIMGLSFYEGKLGNHDVVLSLTGMGKVNAAIGAVLLINHFNCELIINSGIAGGISPLEQRDSVIATSLYYNDVDARIFGYKFGQVPGMPAEYVTNPVILKKVEDVFIKLGYPYKLTKVISGDKFVTSMSQIQNVEDEFGIATEMEGTSIAQVCYRAGVDFVILRYISDIVGFPNQEIEYNQFEEEMSVKSSSITVELLKNLD